MRKWKNIVPTSEKSDLYKLNMDLFNNGKLEDFLLFTQKLQNDARGFSNACHQRKTTVYTYDIKRRRATSI